MADEPNPFSPPEARYDDAPCGLLSTAHDGAILAVNRTLCAWLGFSAAELRGKRLQDLLTMGGKIFHQTHFLPLLQMQGSVAEVQLDLVGRNGRALPALLNAVVRREGETIFHDVAVFHTVDRRKYERELLVEKKRAEALLAKEREAQEALRLAQARLQLALGSAQLLVWDLDLASQLPVYEVGVNRVLGIAGGLPVSAADFANRIHPDDRAAERAAFAQALSPAGDGNYAVEYRLVRHDGTVRVVTSQGKAFFNDNGGLVAFSGVIQDVTDWRRAEEALRAQHQDAQQRATLAEELIGIVSHDLRSPLTVVALGTNLLAAGGVTPAQSRTLTRITSAVQRASRLISDLLDFTQSRLGGGIVVHKSEVDLHALASDAVEELKVVWPGRMLEHRPTGPGTAIADPDRLLQVVTNLVTNALTYGSPERAVTVSSSVDGRAARLCVHNWGPTIPESFMPHLFEPMRRGEHQVKLGSRSVGLGLYIVHEIVGAHGGDVSVSSTPEEGTSFIVTLPW